MVIAAEAGKGDRRFDTEQHKVSVAYLKRIVEDARNKFNIPAIAVSVMNSEHIYSQEVQGTRVFNQPDLATLDDFFHIGSCSKSILAVMAAKFVEQGKINWQTRFFEIFPELLEKANEAYRDITLEDLFLSQAGIKAFTNAEAEPFPEFDPSVKDRRLEFIKYLIAQPPSSKKKDGRFQHLYSNPSYMMASAMLERVSGLRYDELVKNTLIDNLHLGVHIGWPNSSSPDQPWGHSVRKNKVEAYPPDHDYKIPDLIAPAGDLSMTPKDYAKYTQLHLRGLRGLDTYLATDSYQHIHFGHKGFSLGVANGSFDSLTFSGFDGSAGTFYCRSIIVPDSDFAFTIMTNAGSSKGTPDAVDWLTRKIVVEKYNLNWWRRFMLWLWL